MLIPKLLAQSLPAAATLTVFYTVPAGTRAHGETLFVCNAAAVATTFRLSVAPAAANDAAKQYLFYDAPLAANETKLLELDLRLSATDLIRIYTPGANVTFNLFGTEEI